MPGSIRESGCPARETGTGAARLSSARAVRCWVKSRNERNPWRQLDVLPRLPVASRRKAGMTSSQRGPDVLGDTHATMAGPAGGDRASGSESLNAGPSSDRRLKPASVKAELLVTAGQHTAVNTFPGLVHTARHVMGAGNA